MSPHLSIQDRTLLGISTFHAADIENLAGAKGRVSVPIDDLLEQLVRDRMELASSHLVDADHLLNADRFRSSIARYYYSMYHAARAAVFSWHRGDDFEQHSVLPRNFPDDMTDRDLRSEQLGLARLVRNQADYDPYPVRADVWANDARELSSIAPGFIEACATYVAGRRSK